MAFKRVIIRRVGPLSWLLGTMVDIDLDLAKNLAELNSSLSTHQVRAALVATNRETRADSVAHGGTGDEPFWDLVSDERVHVFSVFGTNTFDLYIFAAPDFHELIDKLNSFAMVDVGELKDFLAMRYGITTPHISINRSHAEYWLSA
jgi:hypothetical protein